MKAPPTSSRFGLFAAVFGAALLAAPAALRAQEAPTGTSQPVSSAVFSTPPPPSVPLSPTSQCVEGPGAPPADPSKVTRVPGPAGAPSTSAEAPPEPSIDEPARPDLPVPVLLELGAFAGVSARLDDGPYLNTTRRAGLVLGASAFVWPNRTLAFGLDYAHADLDRVESAPGSADLVAVDHRAHTLMLDARFVPFRASSVSVFLGIGAGFAWQGASTHATLSPRDGFLGGSFQCDVNAGADFAFRAGLGAKARVGRAGSFFGGLDFVGYRLTSDLLDRCAYGAGAAQTLMLRAGFAYDLDISRLVR